MKKLLDRALSLKEELIAHRRFLHQIPEIGMSLPQTKSYVKEQLEAMGYEPQEVLESGLIATVGGKRPGKVFLLRADMDALPMAEQSGEPFAATGDNMHACGHDFHTSMLLGAAKLLKEKEDEIEGTVKLMFQPGEELLEGARDMVKAGILENPKVDAGFAIHVNSLEPPGYFGYNKSYMLASINHVELTVTGQGGHGAMPYLGIDPINGMVQMYSALQGMLTREVNAFDPTVLTFGEFHAGNAANVIPGSGYMRGTLRSFNEESRQFIIQRIQQIVAHEAAACRLKVEVSISEGVPALKMDEGITDLLIGTMDQLAVGNKQIAPRKGMGSEDFAVISNLLPATFLSLGCAVKDETKRYSLHNPCLLLNEDALPYGVVAHVGMALNWLNENK
ncbi:M20 family metallopeptidase [uncultured Vagococcus sp.]|uniref:M20 metallopeptidase family protein n=1 Tax=uncultured Vagococcus sp. TaxID=189676 RepID=UPI0028D86299|nr:M20 family metallopeptidase [uncultured Vagococcus sp.]